MSALPPLPERIALIGPSAAGKTEAGRRLAARLGWTFLDTDALVEARAGCDVPTLFARHGEARFRQLEREAVAEALSHPRTVVATGGGAVLDPGSRRRLLAEAFVVALTAAPETLLQRARAAGLARRPLLAGGDPEARLRRLLEQRAPLYAQAHACVPTDRLTPEEVAAEVLRRHRQGPPWSRYEVAVGGGQVHPVWVGPGLSARLEPAVAALPPAGRPEGAGRPALLVSDEAVYALHGGFCADALAAAGLQPHPALIPPGEESKTLAQAARLYEAAAAARLERWDPVVALGGGVVGDLAGFVAATYLRGVPWLALPTTLLAQVDAAIGGKTGVNLPAGKNLVGAFHPPRAVVCDTALLATLPEPEWRSGLAECVKHGAIADVEYLARLERDAEALRRRDPEALPPLVAGSVAIKAAVVSADPREAGPRALLNFGHTVGHALEAVLEYRDIRHGEAVAVGMAVAADLSVELGLLTPAERDRLEALLVRLGLPVRLPPVPAERLLEAAALDKKRRGGRLRWVLLHGLGSAALHDDVPLDRVRAVLRRRGAR